ncbi:hypothetical protein ASC75_13395 [Aminobacter sp. DSM 101952]|nr:hypothetical protein ASC75_13395 [Aminobacter sp. DSM 101952]
MPRKGEVSAVQSLRNIARAVHTDEEEGNTLLARPLQRGKAMRSLLEACVKLTRNCLDIISLAFGRICELCIGHKHCSCKIPSQSPMGQVAGVLRGQITRFDSFPNFAVDFQIGKLLGQLEILTCEVKTIIQQDLSPMTVKPSNRAHHYVLGQPSDVEPVTLFEKSYQSARIVDVRCRGFCSRIQFREAVPPRSQKCSNRGDRIEGNVCHCRTDGELLLVSQGKLIALVGSIQTKHRLGETWKVAENIPQFNR